MFATDRDVLTLEPSAFRDIAWAGQTLVTGTATIAGTTLTMATQDVGLDAARVDAGMVVVVGDTAYEVIARLSSSQLTVSKVRPGVEDDPLPGLVAVAQAARVSSFGPQLAIVHAQVVRMLGLASGPAGGGDGPGEDAVLNPDELARLVAVGALHLVYSSAAAALGADSAPGQRAEHYREMFNEERRRAVARLDLDGDGLADAVRRPGVAMLGRA